MVFSTYIKLGAPFELSFLFKKKKGRMIKSPSVIYESFNRFYKMLFVRVDV